MFLGVSAYFHDSSVCLLSKNGQLIDYQKEEWHSRIKGDRSFPRLALEQILKNNNQVEKKISKVIFYERPFRAWLTVAKYTLLKYGFKNDLIFNYFKNFWNSSISFYKDLNNYIDIPDSKILYSDHHLSHTLTSLYFKNQYPVTSVVIDGYGDHLTTSIHEVKSNNEINLIWSAKYPNSIGLFYSAITDYLGFKINEGELQVMALASYGKPIYYEDLKKLIYLDEDKKLIINTKYFNFDKSVKKSYSNNLIKIFKVQPRSQTHKLQKEDINFRKYANIAASTQKVIEHLSKKIFKYAFEKTKNPNFIFSGGVALNAKLVTEISKEKFIKSFFVPPSPGDAGSSIGAAYYGFMKSNKNKLNKNIIFNPYIGKFRDKDIYLKKILKKISNKKNTIKTISDLIAKNEIIATCFKNIEIGPRALGHRSIICNGHDNKTLKYLNTQVKNRSNFRPIAPVMTIEILKKYFNFNKKILNLYKSMSALAYINKKKNYKNISPILHSDFTSRVQIVEKGQLLYNVLKNLKQKNITILANTSFNISSDPIVYGFEDAILSIKKMGIKYLMTENGVYKNESI